MIRKASPWVIAGCMLGLNSAAYALGLGEIKLHSNLNQPLNAEIRLLSAESLSKEQIIANLAKASEFERAGVEHNFFLHQLRFRPVFNKDGSVYIKVTTREPVKEPFLDFLLEVNWPNGRVMREYTLLLDPPVFSKVDLTSSPEAPVATSQNDSYQNNRESVSNNSFNEQAVETRTIQTDNWSGSTDGEYRVRDADTLWSIARKNRAQNASIQRTMVAIYESNPDAFNNSNMNELKRGSILKMPDDASVESLSQQQALLEIARQNQLWGGRGGAGTRPDVVVDTAEYATSTATSSANKARLKLSAPGTGDNSANSATMESEAVATLSDENQTLKTRLQDQTDRIEKLERMLALKNDELSSIQNNSAQEAGNNQTEQAENTVAETLSENNDVVPATESGADITTETIDNPNDQINAVNETAASDDTLNSTNSLEADSSSSVAETDAVNDPEKTASDNSANKAPEVADNINTAPVQPAEKSFMDSITDLGMTVWMAIGSGILVIFFSILWFRRRNMEEEDFQESLVVPVGGELNEDDLPVVGDDILAAEMDMDEDYIPESEAMLDDEDALDVESNTDPLGEADVYLAYGKYDQAERILRDALDEEPERTDLRLKLMECFAESKALSEFKEQKRELLEVLATDSAVAEQVSIMEREAWPEEAAKDELPSTEDIFGDLSFAGEAEADDEAEEDELVFPEDSADGTQIEPIGEENVAASDEALEFTPSSAGEESAKADSETEEHLSIDDELENDDLDFKSADMDFSETREEAEEFAESVAEEGVDFISESELMDTEFTDDDLDDELDDDEIDESILDLGDVDEASTKLDLARAYIDMEDYDGASEILQEVVTEGSDKQKAEAEELLTKMK
ncbi:MAG TPA: hypothetical protein ENJ60_17245 [Aeromonadales bacterium]|nr:hypothetical protein [Aeromonadales bacterium]